MFVTTYDPQFSIAYLGATYNYGGWFLPTQFYNTQLSNFILITWTYCFVNTLNSPLHGLLRIVSTIKLDVCLTCEARQHVRDLFNISKTSSDFRRWSFQPISFALQHDSYRNHFYLQPNPASHAIRLSSSASTHNHVFVSPPVVFIITLIKSHDLVWETPPRPDASLVLFQPRANSIEDDPWQDLKGIIYKGNSSVTIRICFTSLFV